MARKLLPIVALAALACCLALAFFGNCFPLNQLALYPAGGNREVLQNGDASYILHLTAQAVTCLSPEGEALAGYLPGAGRAVLSWCISDLENDGQDKILLVLGEEGETFGDSLVILDLCVDGNFREVWQQSCPRLNPWKVQTADVDGDGQREISLGVYKQAKFHPVMAKRPFLYEWQENTLVPKWLGSRLSRPFEEYIFADLDNDGKDELIAVELLESGENVVQAYAWKGFGFEGVACSAPFARIYSLRTGGKVNAHSVQAQVRTDDKTAWQSFYLQGEQLLHSGEQLVLSETGEER